MFFLAEFHASEMSKFRWGNGSWAFCFAQSCPEGSALKLSEVSPRQRHCPSCFTLLTEDIIIAGDSATDTLQIERPEPIFCMWRGSVMQY